MVAIIFKISIILLVISIVLLTIMILILYQVKNHIVIERCLLVFNIGVIVLILSIIGVILTSIVSTKIARYSSAEYDTDKIIEYIKGHDYSYEIENIDTGFESYVVIEEYQKEATGSKHYIIKYFNKVETDNIFDKFKLSNDS